jgi:ABC-type transport system involved in cytochrome bd biosynthesis fused ATPase/permease subunit
MVLVANKEKPNTSNIIVWKENFDGYPSKIRKDNSTTESVGKRQTKKNYSWLERLEFYFFLILASIIWSLVVFKILIWYRFPFHRHKLEVILMIVVPIIAILLVLVLMDIGLKFKED